MKLSKSTLDKTLTVVVAVSAAVQGILVAQGIETSDLAAEVASALAVLTGGYHGGAAVVNRTTEPSVPVL